MEAGSMTRFRPRRSTSTVVALAAATLMAALATPSAVDAQVGRRRISGTIDRPIDSISPRIGPVGQVVRVASGEMPSITPIRVGIGAMRVGFEAYEELLTSMDGEFATTVTVPAWATWDRVHRFIVLDIYFAPIALSEPFHVTDERGMVRREGHVLSTSPQCAVFEDLDGLGYALVGSAVAGLEADAEAIVEGRIMERPACEQELSIEIARVWDPRGGH